MEDQTDKCDNEEQEPCLVVVMKNGPLLVPGNITVMDAEGKESSRQNITAFCRCGVSKNKPFCDGAHNGINFKG